MKSESEENGGRCVVGTKDRVAMVQDQLPATRRLGATHTTRTHTGHTGTVVVGGGRKRRCKVMAVEGASQERPASPALRAAL